MPDVRPPVDERLVRLLWPALALVGLLFGAIGGKPKRVEDYLAGLSGGKNERQQALYGLARLALRRERAIKRLSKTAKEALILATDAARAVGTFAVRSPRVPNLRCWNRRT